MSVITEASNRLLSYVVYKPVGQRYRVYLKSTLEGLKMSTLNVGVAFAGVFCTRKISRLQQRCLSEILLVFMICQTLASKASVCLYRHWYIWMFRKPLHLYELIKITQGFITTMQQEYLLIIIFSNVLYANYKDNSESGKERCICIYFFCLVLKLSVNFVLVVWSNV